MAKKTTTAALQLELAQRDIRIAALIGDNEVLRRECDQFRARLLSQQVATHTADAMRERLLEIILRREELGQGRDKALAKLMDTVSTFGPALLGPLLQPAPPATPASR